MRDEIATMLPPKGTVLMCTFVTTETCQVLRSLEPSCHDDFKRKKISLKKIYCTTVFFIHEKYKIHHRLRIEIYMYGNKSFEDVPFPRLITITCIYIYMSIFCIKFSMNITKIYIPEMSN